MVGAVGRREGTSVCVCVCVRACTCVGGGGGMRFMDFKMTAHTPATPDEYFLPL